MKQYAIGKEKQSLHLKYRCVIGFKLVPVDFNPKREKGKQDKINLFIGCKEGK